MTTKVTVHANGPCYPARVVKFDKDGNAVEDHMISSGYSFELWVGPEQTISVTEEFHPHGYPAKPTAEHATS